MRSPRLGSGDWDRGSLGRTQVGQAVRWTMGFEPGAPARTTEPARLRGFRRWTLLDTTPTPPDPWKRCSAARPARAIAPSPRSQTGRLLALGKLPEPLHLGISGRAGSSTRWDSVFVRSISSRIRDIVPPPEVCATATAHCGNGGSALARLLLCGSVGRFGLSAAATPNVPNWWRS